MGCNSTKQNKDRYLDPRNPHSSYYKKDIESNKTLQNNNNMNQNNNNNNHQNNNNNNNNLLMLNIPSVKFPAGKSILLRRFDM